MKLIRDESCVLKPGDYGAKIVGEDLHIPAALDDWLISHEHSRDPLVFLSLVMNSPADLALSFGWDMDQALSASNLLLFVLDGFTGTDLLRPPQGPTRTYGLLPEDEN